MLDVRGVEIEVGATVVTAIGGDRLLERTVTRLEPERLGGQVWCGAFCTNPERCVVVALPTPDGAISGEVLDDVIGGLSNDIDGNVFLADLLAAVSAAANS